MKNRREMKVTAQDVQKLRKLTGVSIMACKGALVDAQGNVDKAIKLLRERGKVKIAKREDNTLKEGFLISNSSKSRYEFTVFKCETESVAKNEEVQEVALEIALNSLVETKFDSQEKLEQLQIKVNEKIQVEVMGLDVAENEMAQSYIHTNKMSGAIVKIKLKDRQGKGNPKLKELLNNLALQVTAG